MEVLDNIPVGLDPKEVLNPLHSRKEMETSVEELIELVRPLARPKAVYEVCYVDTFINAFFCRT